MKLLIAMLLVAIAIVVPFIYFQTKQPTEIVFLQLLVCLIASRAIDSQSKTTNQNKSNRIRDAPAI
jgi:glucose dehydrogenase